MLPTAANVIDASLHIHMMDAGVSKDIYTYILGHIGYE
jgi:hypothetical protein